MRASEANENFLCLVISEGRFVDKKNPKYMRVVLQKNIRTEAGRERRERRDVMEG